MKGVHCHSNLFLLKKISTCRRYVSSVAAQTSKTANYDTIESKFRMTSGFWSNKKNHQIFLDWVAKKLKIRDQHDWYRVETRTIDDLGGHQFLHQYYHSSLALALQSVYSDKKWFPWKFAGGVPNGYWKDASNQRFFFDWLKEQLSIQKTEQWYYVKISDVVAHGGGHLLKTQYHGSLGLALEAIYPEIEWLPWKFQGGVPNEGYWDHEGNILKFVKHLTEYYDLTLHDLRWITAKNIRDIGGGSLLTKIGGLDNFVRQYFPAIEPANISKGQFRLHQAVQSLFPGHQVIMNYRIPAIRYHSCELDVFVPHLNLGLEYQGQYHYQWTYLHGLPEEQQNRDKLKKEVCKESNITLIEVPFWWDMKTASLAATIQKARPDIALTFDPSTKPISTEVPQSVLEASQKMYNQRTLKREEDLPPAPYVLSVTTYRSKCYRCKTPLKKGDLKIQAYGIFNASDSASYRAKYSLCFKKNCLENVPKNNPKVIFPAFENSIAVPQQVKEILESKHMQSQLDQLSDVHWVYL